MSESNTIAREGEGQIITIISAEDAAKLLGLHKVTLYDGARRGEIPCRRVGRRFIFVRETLLEWLRSSGQGAAATG